MESQVFVHLNNTMPRPRATMTARKRKSCGCVNHAGLGTVSPPLYTSNPYLDSALEFGGLLPALTTAATEYTASVPVQSASDVAANVAGKPLTQDEINALNAQTASQVQQACGNQANTTWCNQQIQSAQAAVTAAAQQSNQQLAGPPYSYVLAAENYLNNLTLPSLPSLPSWIWWAAAALGFVLIYEAA